ncbi:MAG: aspartyl/glutamyl-tRNA(Asn/Gln) amidotransferase subunit C [Sorangiineae bacterium NIC37A_2]|jgi:aspartyl-tRNA(Asn)/glutamyl-tRNA(Gln) amidotransferase subunit C|nr:MAG: aspartyl/glutamyl-tRNA(Asn/Gln) amidotransferase subunit C [Sorangiineae bacterium NIC37A_2]
MAISVDEVRTVARLARLALDEARVEELAHELGKILGYVDQLNELDTSNVEPTLQVGTLSAPLREDVVRPGLEAVAAYREAPRTSPDGFLVPGFVDESSGKKGGA